MRLLPRALTVAMLCTTWARSTSAAATGTDATTEPSSTPSNDSYLETEAVRRYRRPRKEIPDLCSQLPCCRLSSTQNCCLSGLGTSQQTLVYPGGRTTCALGSEYAFQVWPGARNRVLFYFQGYGGCFTPESFEAGTCSPYIVPQAPDGVFDRSDPRNPHRTDTVVYVTDCSGDAHTGNLTQPFEVQGKTVTQRGQENVRSVVAYVVDMQRRGELAQTLDQVVIMGCSAGSLGTQVWGNFILSKLRWRKAALVPDSYVGVFPLLILGQLLKMYNFCSSGLLSPILYAKCQAGLLSVQDIALQNIAALAPLHVPVAFLQTKVDPSQIFFYNAFVSVAPELASPITEDELYESVNEYFYSYNFFPNFLAYLADGNQHCYTENPTFYTAGPRGPQSGPVDGKPSMAEWVAAISEGPKKPVQSVCVGPSRPPFPADFIDTANNTYCSIALFPKIFYPKLLRH